MKIGPESVLEFLLASNGIFGKAFQPVLSWSFQLEGQVFDGVEIIFASHVDVKNKVLNPDPRVHRSVVCLYVHRFKALWEFMVQYFFGQAQGVCSPSVSRRVMACSRLLLCPEFIPNWYLACISIWLTILPRRGVSFRSVDGPGCTGLLIQLLM